MSQEVPKLESWAMEIAEKLAPTLTGIDRVRIAIGLIQARATECLHYSGKFAIGGYLQAVIADSKKLRMPSLDAAFALQFSDRHAQLEEFGMKLAQKYAGPMVEGESTEGSVQ